MNPKYCYPISNAVMLAVYMVIKSTTDFSTAAYWLLFVALFVAGVVIGKVWQLKLK